MEALSVVSRVGVGVVFLVAAFTKIPTWSVFPDMVARLVPVGKPTAKATAAAIVAAEFTIGCLLVAGLATGPAVIAASVLLGTFATTLALNIFAGKEGHACGCFGANSRISWAHVLRNVALAAHALISVLPGASAILAFISAATVSLSFAHRLRAPPAPKGVAISAPVDLR